MAAVAITRDRFERLMLRLDGLKFKPQTLDTHWDALQDLSEPLLTAAIAEAQREAEEFPSPRMLRLYADAARPRIAGPEPDRSRPITPRTIDLPTGDALTIDRQWRYYCDTCSDTGWRTYTCGQLPGMKPWNAIAACNRTRPHGPHEWAGPCVCVDRNPAVARKREQDIQHAAGRAKARD